MSTTGNSVTISPSRMRPRRRKHGHRKFTVTSRITSASLRLRATAYTTHKVWTQLAETDWYTPSADRFTLTSARQLAGLAQLVKQGNSFAGKTILLGADISLANDDKTFNRSVRWFDGIGSTQAPFAGTFDGNGYQSRR